MSRAESCNGLTMACLARIKMSAGQWDERYSQSDFAYGTEPNDWLKDQATCLVQSGQILCLAEGEGRNATHLAKLGLKVTAVDQSAVGLSKAKQLATQAGVSFDTVVADLTDYDLGTARWDGIVSIWCHLPSQLRCSVHAGVLKALKPGAYFILEAYSPAQLALGTGGPKEADMLATLDQLKDELKGLDWQAAQNIQRVVEEGRFHGGLSDVVQLLGRKPQL